MRKKYSLLQVYFEQVSHYDSHSIKLIWMGVYHNKVLESILRNFCVVLRK